jgi:hypothetical protein
MAPYVYIWQKKITYKVVPDYQPSDIEEEENRWWRKKTHHAVYTANQTKKVHIICIDNTPVREAPSIDIDTKKKWSNEETHTHTHYWKSTRSTWKLTLFGDIR